MSYLLIERLPNYIEHFYFAQHYQRNYPAVKFYVDPVKVLDFLNELSKKIMSESFLKTLNEIKSEVQTIIVEYSGKIFHVSATSETEEPFRYKGFKEVGVLVKIIFKQNFYQGENSQELTLELETFIRRCWEEFLKEEGK